MLLSLNNCLFCFIISPLAVMCKFTVHFSIFILTFSFFHCCVANRPSKFIRIFLRGFVMAHMGLPSCLPPLPRGSVHFSLNLGGWVISHSPPPHSGRQNINNSTCHIIGATNRRWGVSLGWRGKRAAGFLRHRLLPPGSQMWKPLPLSWPYIGWLISLSPDPMDTRLLGGPHPVDFNNGQVPDSVGT